MKTTFVPVTLLVLLAACDTESATRPVSAIVNSLRTAPPLARQKLAMELRGHGKAAVAAWVELLQDKKCDYNLYVIAAGELGAMGAEAQGAVQILAKYLRDGFPGMTPADLSVGERFKTRDVARMPAIGGLKGIGAPCVRAVRGLLADSSGRARQESALILGSLQAVAAIPDLIRLLDDPDKAVATSAVWALGEIQSPTPEVQKALLHAFRNDEPLVRFEAVKSVGKLGKGAIALREDVRKMTGDPDSGVRRNALLVLKQMPPSAPPAKAESQPPAKKVDASGPGKK